MHFECQRELLLIIMISIVFVRDVLLRELFIQAKVTVYRTLRTTFIYIRDAPVIINYENTLELRSDFA